MKNNKACLRRQGFAPIAIVLIIVAVLVVGGGLYYSSKNTNPLYEEKDDGVNPLYQNQDQVVNPPVTNPPVQPPQNEIVSNCLLTDPPSITIASPNGGELWKIGQTYAVKWSTCNEPENSWVRFSYSIPSGVGNIRYTRDCFGGEVLASSGNFNWTISSSVFGCSDAGYTFPPTITFQTKVKAELYTGAPMCEGLPVPTNPCVTSTRTLHAQDESDNNFSITNL